MVPKLEQFSKLGPFSTFQLFKLSKLCYNFWSNFENKFFFYIPSYPPPIAVRYSLTNQFSPQKNDFSVYFQQQQKSAKLKCWEGSRKSLSLFSLFLKIYRNINFCLAKLIDHWIPDGVGRGIARDIKSKNIYFNFQDSTKNGNKVWTI